MKSHALPNRLIFVCIAIGSLAVAQTTITAQTSNDIPNETIADRVVVAINNIPYTQLQVETYLDVKESLRDNPEASQVVKQENWTAALDAFVKDMAIHQEASKSSGFRPTKESIQKLRARAEKASANLPQFRAAFDRLMLGRADLESEILRVATVENYRRGKASLNAGTKDDKDIVKGWESELQSRTIIRFFDQAKSWKNINPHP